MSSQAISTSLSEYIECLFYRVGAYTCITFRVYLLDNLRTRWATQFDTLPISTTLLVRDLWTDSSLGDLLTFAEVEHVT